MDSRTNKNEKPVGIKEIAEALGITASTVSRALNDNPRISEPTRKKVQALAKSMNYRHNAMAAGLRTGKSNILGVIIPVANRSFFASVIAGIERMANQAKYNVIICQTNEDINREREAIEALLRTRVDGIAISVSANTIDFSHFELVKNAEIPLILFDRTYDAIGAHQVLIDDRLGAKKAIEHLIQQGCRKIVHLGGKQHVSIYQARLKGYLDALQEAKIAIEENLIFYTDAKENSATQAINTLLEKGIDFDGIFAVSDYAAIDAMKLLQARGVKVPEQVAIIGFADESFTRWVTPSLSSVNQHAEGMGNAVADLFLSLVQNYPTGEAMTLNKVILDPEIVVRGSSSRF